MEDSFLVDVLGAVVLILSFLGLLAAGIYSVPKAWNRFKYYRKGPDTFRSWSEFFMMVVILPVLCLLMNFGTGAVVLFIDLGDFRQIIVRILIMADIFFTSILAVGGVFYMWRIEEIAREEFKKKEEQSGRIVDHTVK